MMMPPRQTRARALTINAGARASQDVPEALHRAAMMAAATKASVPGPSIGTRNYSISNAASANNQSIVTTATDAQHSNSSNGSSVTLNGKTQHRNSTIPTASNGSNTNGNNTIGSNTNSSSTNGGSTNGYSYSTGLPFTSGPSYSNANANTNANPSANANATGIPFDFIGNANNIPSPYYLPPSLMPPPTANEGIQSLAYAQSNRPTVNSNNNTNNSNTSTSSYAALSNRNHSVAGLDRRLSIPYLYAAAAAAGSSSSASTSLSASTVLTNHHHLMSNNNNNNSSMDYSNTQQQGQSFNIQGMSSNYHSPQGSSLNQSYNHHDDHGYFPNYGQQQQSQHSPYQLPTKPATYYSSNGNNGFNHASQQYNNNQGFMPMMSNRLSIDYGMTMAVPSYMQGSSSSSEQQSSFHNNRHSQQLQPSLMPNSNDNCKQLDVQSNTQSHTYSAAQSHTQSNAQSAAYRMARRASMPAGHPFNGSFNNDLRNGLLTSADAVATSSMLDGMDITDGYLGYDYMSTVGHEIDGKKNALQVHKDSSGNGSTNRKSNQRDVFDSS